jgi:hypothetical protein
VGKTATYGLPFPADTDAPDGPSQLKALAEAVEKAMLMGITPYAPVIIETEQSRSEATYGTLGTPDEIPGIVVPAGGLLLVEYRAVWKQSVQEKARAAIFLGENQLKVRTGNSSTAEALAAAFNAVTNFAYLSTSSALGLQSTASGMSGTLNVTTTGLLAGGFAPKAQSLLCELGGTLETLKAAEEAPRGFGGLAVIEGLAAGTYNLSIRFKALEGSVTAKKRLLSAYVLGKRE